MSDLPAPPTPSTPASEVRRAAGPRVAIALALASVLVAAGAVYVLRSATTSALDARVPATSAAFVELNLRPGADQANAIDELLSGLNEQQRAGVNDGIDEALEQIFAELDLSWRDDVKGWIGTRIAVVVPVLNAETFAVGPQVVALLGVRDEGAARRSLQRATESAEGSAAFEIADGVAYVSDQAATITRLRDGAETAPLSEKEEYVAERARHGDVLAFAWFDASGLAALGGGLLGGQQTGDTSFGMSLRAEADAIVVEGGGGDPAAAGAAPAILQASAATLLGALTVFDLGTGLESAAMQAGALGQVPGVSDLLAALDEVALDLERDVAPWMKGEMSLIVGALANGPLPDVGVVFEVTDEDALDRFAGKIRSGIGRLARSVGIRGVRASGDRRALDIESGGPTIAMRRANGVVAFATSPAYARALLDGAPAPLGDDPAYRRAIGEGGGDVVFQVFIRVDRIRDLVLFAIPSEDRAEYESGIGPLVNLFESFAIRSTADGRFRMVLTVPA